MEIKTREGVEMSTRRSCLVMVGELTLDDVVVEDTGVIWKVPGGGALYSAIGALIWDAHPVLCAAIGSDYPEHLVAKWEAAGIDPVGLTRVAGNGLGIWLLYEQSGYRHQIPKASGAPFESIDRARRSWDELGLPRIDGVHVAPQTSEAQIDANMRILRAGVTSTMDLMVESFIDIEKYRTGQALQGVTALIMNEIEANQIWGLTDLSALLDELSELGGVKYLAIKRGSQGVTVVTSEAEAHIPALSSSAVDPTGAGDAFSGGFLAGLVRTGDPIEAGVWGAVSASIAVEARGPEDMLTKIDPDAISIRHARGVSLVRIG